MKLIQNKSSFLAFSFAAKFLSVVADEFQDDIGPDETEDGDLLDTPDDDFDVLSGKDVGPGELPNIAAVVHDPINVESNSQFIQYTNEYGGLNQGGDQSNNDPNNTNSVSPNPMFDSSDNLIANFFGALRTDVVHTYGLTCGTVDPNRIVNGVDGDVVNTPWQVFLLICDNNGGCYNCGGSIISDEWVLTAGHCVDVGSSGVQYIITFFGISEIAQPLNLNPYRAASTYVIHSNYQVGGVFNDIAVIKQQVPFDFGPNSFPVCLPKSDMCLTEKYKVKATGWGKLVEGGSSPSKMQEIEQYIEKYGDCDWFMSNAFGNPFGHYLTLHEICAGGRMLPGDNVWKDTCQGDSGGPLSYMDGNNVGTVMGVVSWGIGCARPGYPGMYTRVTNYLDWIYTNTQIKMAGDSVSLVPTEYCIDNEERAGFVDLTGTADESDYAADTSVVPEDSELHIGVRGMPNACLGKSRRRMNLDFRRGKFLTLVQRCDLITDYMMNANYEFRYDDTNGRIYGAGFHLTPQCILRTNRWAYVTKCESTHFPGVRQSQQWDYLPDAGAILGKDKERGMYRAIYYGELQPEFAEYKLRMAPYLFSHWGSDSALSDGSNEISLSAEENTKMFGNDAFCLRSTRATVGHMHKLRMYPCTSSENAGKWIYDDVNNRIKYNNPNDASDPNNDQLCLFSKGGNKPVYAATCSLSGTTNFEAEYFSWVWTGRDSAGDGRIWMDDVNNPETWCIYMNQKNKYLYTGKCSARNFGFGN